MLKGLGALKSQLKIVGKLETDCDQTKGFNQAQTILTANPDLKAMYSACGPPALGADQALTNAHVEPVGLRHGRLRRPAGGDRADQGGRENASVAQFPFNIGLYGVQTLWKVVNGKRSRRTSTRAPRSSPRRTRQVRLAPRAASTTSVLRASPQGGARSGEQALDRPSRLADALLVLDQREPHETLAARAEPDARDDRDLGLLHQPAANSSVPSSPYGSGIGAQTNIVPLRLRRSSHPMRAARRPACRGGRR